MKNSILSVLFVFMALSANAQASETNYFFKIKWEQHTGSTLVKILRNDIYISLSDSMMVYKNQMYHFISLYTTDDLYST